MTRLHNNKGAKESLAFLLHKPSDNLNQSTASAAGKADQNDTGRTGITDKDQPAKVFILCK